MIKKGAPNNEKKSASRAATRALRNSTPVVDKPLEVAKDGAPKSQVAPNSEKRGTESEGLDPASKDGTTVAEERQAGNEISRSESSQTSSADTVDNEKGTTDNIVA